MELLGPAAFAGIVYLVFLQRLQARAAVAPWREALLSTAIAAGVAVTLITEALSAFDAITRGAIFASWCVAAVGVAGWQWHTLARFRPPPIVFRKLTKTGWLAAGGIVAILSTTLLIALVAPPNTWDSMTYHMARVMHWMENHSVRFFGSSEPRELWPYPWAEYVVLHFQLLTGGDRFANVVQWGASVVAAAGGSLIARQFSSRGTVQLLAGLFSLSIPMALLEATSTQNDYVESAFLVCFLYYALRWSENRDGWARYGLAAGCALGLGVLTKPLIVLYASPLLAYAILRRGGARSIGAAARFSLVAGALTLALAAGHLVRLRDFPMEEQAAAVRNAEYSPRVFVSNVLRNATLHLSTPSKTLNQAIQRAVVALHVPLGLDPSDQATTHAPGYVFFAVNGFRYHEDYTGNPIHFVLFLFAFVFCAWRARRSRRARDLLGYGGAIVLGALAFCLLMRWSPWSSRLQLPLFVVGAPFLALSLAGFARGRLVAAVAAVLLVTAAPALLDNDSRPLRGPKSILKLSREQALFNNRPDLYEPYVQARKFLRGTGCRDVGMVFAGENWEYPLWVVTARLPGPPRLRHVTIHPYTAAYATRAAHPPCALITHNRAAAELEIEGQRFHRVWESRELFGYVPDGPAAPPRTDQR